MRGKSERMDKAINTVRARAYQYACDYRVAWIKWMDDDEQEGFTFAQVEQHLETRKIL